MPATVDFGVPARMRDGTILRADVYRPDGEGPWPTLLLRTPYGKEQARSSATRDPLAAVREGFMVVVQDARGRFASDGEWTPLLHERRDGFDTVEWAARLPGSNGRVGMYGASYCGNTQWMAALEQPPSLRAIVPLVTWSEPLDGVLARGGARELGLNALWALTTRAAQLGRLELSDAERERRMATLLDDVDALATSGYWELPVASLDVLRRHDALDLGATRLDEEAGVATRGRVAGAHERVLVPALNVGGWHDLFVQGTIDNHMALTALGRPSRLVVGPWGHDPMLAETVGDLCFGIRANGIGIPAHDEGDLTRLQFEWLRRHLVPGATPPPDEAPVRIFVMGRDAWRDEQAWPPARAREQRWHLHADGGLSPEPPATDAPASEYLYDPADPVPTVGGSVLLAPAFRLGPLEQRRVEERPDVLVFTSDPLDAELEVTGRVRVVLHAASSAPSTDWVARLCDVHPDGCSFNVCDGIVRIAEGADRSQRVEIDLWSTSQAFLPGHRLRVHVTSSSFPRWDRNLNTGDQRAARVQVARQRVHHDADRPSWIELPVCR
jgi:uncharacterized protein